VKVGRRWTNLGGELGDRRDGVGGVLSQEGLMAPGKKGPSRHRDAIEKDSGPLNVDPDRKRVHVWSKVRG
jgi:hypothetical protein